MNDDGLSFLKGTGGKWECVMTTRWHKLLIMEFIVRDALLEENVIGYRIISHVKSPI